MILLVMKNIQFLDFECYFSQNYSKEFEGKVTQMPMRIMAMSCKNVPKPDINMPCLLQWLSILFNIFVFI